MNKFVELKAFTTVAETGGFSAAARSLALTPSSVVRAVDALELRLGVDLFVRSTRSVTLTESGQRYFQSVQSVLQQMEQADDAAAALEGEPQGLLKVTAPVTFGTLYVAPLLDELYRLYPRLELDFQLSDSFSNMIDESIDVAIRIGAAADQPNLIARRLAGHERVICASPAYLDQHGIAATPSELLQHDCLQFSYDGPRRGWRFRQKSGAPEDIEEIGVSGSLSVNNADMLRQAAIAGQGVVMLADWLVRADIAAGRLVRILSDYEVNPASMDIGIFAMYSANRRGSTKVKAFVDLLLTRLGPQIECAPHSVV
jgi:DNA-binding transcriptional LysR family regulator